MDLELTDLEVKVLESLLLRVRAAATTDRNQWRRLYGSYGGRRESVDTRLEQAEQTIEQTNYFLEKIKEHKSEYFT